MYVVFLSGTNSFFKTETHISIVEDFISLHVDVLDTCTDWEFSLMVEVSM